VPDPNRKLTAAVVEIGTQLRRLADAHTTPVIANPDAPTTTPDGPRCVCGDPIVLSGDPARWIHGPGSDTSCLKARPNLPDNGRRLTHWMPISPELAAQRAETMNVLERYIDSRPPCIPDHGAPVHCPGCAAGDGAEQPPDPEALRAKVDEATATLRRIRAVARNWGPCLLPRSEAHRLHADLCAALEGPRPDASTTDDDASALRMELHAQDERIEELEARRDELRVTLHDVLRHFVHKGHPGEPCLSSGWVAEKTVTRWRTVLQPPAVEEQPGPAEQPKKRPTPFECEPGNRCNNCAVCWS
jgi:hypothetical protein